MTTTLSHDPRTGDPFGEPIPHTALAELNRLLAAADDAAPVWAATPGAQRARVLEAVADALDGSVDSLVEIADRETALGPIRLRGEVARTTGQLRMFAELAREGSYVDAILSPADPATGRPDVRRLLVPVGAIGVYSASNFPFAFSVAGGDTASALAVGCPVIVKAHDGHPATSLATAGLIQDALRAAGAPEGLFGIVFGREAGQALVQAPAVKAVGFTGSTAGGRALFDLACSRPDPVPFYGELGSVNPVVVLPAAAAHRSAAIADGYADSLLLGTGQFCTNPGLLFVPAGSPLLAEISRAVGGRVGGAMLTGRVHRAYEEAIAEPVWSDLDLVAHGTADDAWGGTPDVRSVSLAEFAERMAELDVERFGPAGLVITYDSVAELVPVLARVTASLTATIHADAQDSADVDAVRAPLSRLAGRLLMNGWPTGVAVCWAMHHGGPWPATTVAAHTSVGATALRRWLIPIAYQNWPDDKLPLELREANPLGISRTVQP